MEKEQIHLGDIKRILIGNAPPKFLIEVFFRTVIIYTALLIFLRWLGKRMAGQLTITEMSVMIMLGAIVGSPIQMPDKGILTGLLVLFCAVLLQRLITWLAFKKERVERLTTGKTDMLVKDGILLLDKMRDVRVSRQQLFSVLREKQIYNLAKVKRVYLEACGLFSIYKHEEDRPGLGLFPQRDQVMYEHQKKPKDDIRACVNCGYTNEKKELNECPNCKSHSWIKAVI